MDDVITDFLPPSRLYFEDLNAFSPPPSPLPRPFILWSNTDHNPDLNFHPKTLIVAISKPSCFFLHHVTCKTLIGTVVLPEISVSGKTLDPSHSDNSCNIFKLDSSPETFLLLIQYTVCADRASALAKLVFDEIKPEKTLIFGSIQSCNYRGTLPVDETLVFKLETSKQRDCKDEGDALGFVKDLSYFPSGNLIDGVGAALLAKCQIRGRNGILLVSWPEYGGSIVSLLKSFMLNVSKELDCDIDGETLKDSHSDSELYS
ncbi:uncharacterized protein LOC18433185 [Amborella trichopoda]|uniref:Proteasome assembly chaperone 1 n=1 Tax=Amborella trichopoda TaxID=13333 RepID=W1PAP4_AMBTC|nr:uncharacterized protein LOC18433185 [Amborella trichopoda]ERN05018.1 hypothetical protein AMTR_s00053p00036280 [Amborella trichopoda]|eukprot:XP_006843343.1 uncharacterized protein LOC18433185 [Amborella trichopoda]